MGRAMIAGLPAQQGIEVVGGLRAKDDAASTKSLFAKSDVLVDFTHADVAPGIIARAIEAGVRPVIGTTGLSERDLAAVDTAARQRGIGAVWAANFRLLGVLLAHFARIAARYTDTVEIIEAHHATKADAPSGTARELARLVRAAHGSALFDAPVQRETLAGVRGGVHEGVRVHSLRLPNLQPNGWHEIVFAGDQETLTIRHDDWGVDSYVGPVAMAVRKVMEPGVVGLVRGFDRVLGLDESS
jgi:4-hydroxy-tetrahydrodipicolinate reductase